MANICDMNLYIVAATADDMRSLLVTMAENFEKATNINLLSKVDSSADWRTFANAMERGSVGYNKLCFLSPDPDSRSEYGSFLVTTANGRPCIVVSMGLKWAPSFQVEEFCDSLDDSRYGFAFIDGGEYKIYNDDETANIQWGNPLGDSYDVDYDRDEFMSEQTKAFGSIPTTLHEMALHKLLISEDVRDFFQSPADEDEDSAYDVDEDSGYEYSYYSSINWAKPTSEDLSTITSVALEVFTALPFDIRVYHGFTSEGNAVAETLMPGDTVMIVGEWEGDSSCGMYVKTVGDNKQLGRIDWVRIVVDYSVNDVANRVLTLLLPHMRANIIELVPVSLRAKGAEGLTLGVRLEAMPTDFVEAMKGVRALLDKGYSERTVSSFVGEAMRR